MNWSDQERRWWIGALALIVSIYATLYFARAPVEFLRERNLLRLTVGAVFVVAALGAVRVVRFRGVGLREGLVFLTFGAAFGGAVLLVDRPEEKLHFLEYGLLGGLLCGACRERAVRLGRSPLSAAATALVLAALAGWGDEGIQAILPNRVYDVRDILWNVSGSTIVILAQFAAGTVRRSAPGL
ncbi:MAG: hypothetical protein GY769_09470 [bacterium]|nr:hypothetical protein [bacterium]